MTITLYITRTGDMIQTGKPAEVTLEEYPEISRTWTRRVAVELPAGFEAAEAGDGRKHIFRGSDCYELTAVDILAIERALINRCNNSAYIV